MLSSKVTYTAFKVQYAFYQSVHSLGIEPMTLLLLAAWSTFTFMHLPDSFIQKKICIASKVWILWVHAFPGNRTHDLAVDLHLHLCIWRMLLCKVTYNAFRICILLVHAFPGNRTHDVASTMIYIYIYVFGRYFYPKLLTLHSRHEFYIFIHYLGIEPTTLPLLVTWSTFTFMYLADAFMQSDLHCIQDVHFPTVCIPWEC